jgi:hypothetical protein
VGAFRAHARVRLERRTENLRSQLRDQEIARALVVIDDEGRHAVDTAKPDPAVDFVEIDELSFELLAVGLRRV